MQLDSFHAGPVFIVIDLCSDSLRTLTCTRATLPWRHLAVRKNSGERVTPSPPCVACVDVSIRGPLLGLRE
jgi:hypothetical protein